MHRFPGLRTLDELLPGLRRQELPPAPSGDAARQRRRRERMRDGKIVLTVEADEVALTEALVVGGFLDPAHVDDRARIAAAVERLLGVVTRDNAPP